MYFHTKVGHDMHSKVFERTMNVFKKEKEKGINKNGKLLCVDFSWMVHCK